MLTYDVRDPLLIYCAQVGGRRIDRREVRGACRRAARAARHREVQRAAGGRARAVDRGTVRRAAREERRHVSTHTALATADCGAG